MGIFGYPFYLTPSTNSYCLMIDEGKSIMLILIKNVQNGCVHACWCDRISHIFYSMLCLCYIGPCQHIIFTSKIHAESPISITQHGLDIIVEGNTSMAWDGICLCLVFLYGIVLVLWGFTIQLLRFTDNFKVM